MAEFQRLFSKYGAVLTATEINLKEIKADPMTVVVHKASQLGERVLVEDTSLRMWREPRWASRDVRWLLHHLAEYAGRKAHWRVLLAYREGDLVYFLSRNGRREDRSSRGKEGFGFDPVFLPDGSDQTLAQAKPDEVNARAKAVDALLTGKPIARLPPIVDWKGEWQ